MVEEQGRCAVPPHSLRREIALVKVLCPADVQHTLAEVTSRGGVRVAHRDDSSMILEIVAEPEKLDAILGQLDLSIVEFMRSGTLAMSLMPRPGPPAFDERLNP